MSDAILHCDGRDAERCDCCPANDPAQPDVCWLTAALSAMTAAELVERLAGFYAITISHESPGEERVVSTKRMRRPPHHLLVEKRTVIDEKFTVMLHSGGPGIITEATTLSAALEEALRKAEER